MKSHQEITQTDLTNTEETVTSQEHNITGILNATSITNSLLKLVTKNCSKD